MFDRLHTAVLNRLGEQGLLDWSRASLDSVNVRAKRGALSGPNPTDRGKRDTNYHLLVDAHGLPLNVAVSGANRNDSMLVEPILDSMPAMKRGGQGHPAGRSSCMPTRATTSHASAVTCTPARGHCSDRPHRPGLQCPTGQLRWVVECTLG